jgi:hypothetical protein
VTRTGERYSIFAGFATDIQNGIGRVDPPKILSNQGIDDTKWFWNIRQSHMESLNKPGPFLNLWIAIINQRFLLGLGNQISYMKKTGICLLQL